MPNKTAPLLTCLLALSLTACNRSLPKLSDLPKLTVYKIDIAQGNIVEAVQIAKLTVGMAQRHVQVLLGTPLIKDPFNPQRWDYIYNYQPGGEARQQRQVTLFFDDQQLLSRIAGDVVGELRTTPLQVSRAKTTIKIPPRKVIEDETFWRGLRNRLPLIGEKSEPLPETNPAPIISQPVATSVASAAPISTTALPTSIAPIPESLDRPLPIAAQPADRPSAMTSGPMANTAADNSSVLQPGISLTELNSPDAPELEQAVANEPVPLDDDSGLFDGLLRKIGGG
ncbi:MAG: outer membrane protein assembly factor BamE [Immundisolibacteraceae bacterium]|nr:outer membrane protein assembly factor BamE [Immundisolibacteraceae bacterium]